MKFHEFTAHPGGPSKYYEPGDFTGSAFHSDWQEVAVADVTK